MTETRNQARNRELERLESDGETIKVLRGTYLAYLDRIEELEDIGDKLVAKVNELKEVNEEQRAVISMKQKLLHELAEKNRYLEEQLTEYSLMGTAQAEELSKLRAFKTMIKELMGLTD